MRMGTVLNGNVGTYEDADCMNPAAGLYYDSFRFHENG